jgi:hypothetical protein
MAQKDKRLSKKVIVKGKISRGKRKRLAAVLDECKTMPAQLAAPHIRKLHFVANAQYVGGTTVIANIHNGGQLDVIFPH